MYPTINGNVLELLQDLLGALLVREEVGGAQVVVCLVIVDSHPVAVEVLEEFLWAYK
jgi:hypothetical protein